MNLVKTLLVFVFLSTLRFPALAARVRGDSSMMGPPVPLITYDERWSGQSTTYSERRFSVTKPVMKNEKETMSVSLLGGQTQFGDEIVLDSGIVLPTQLSRVDIGTQYFYQLEDRKNWGVRGLIGYAGDRLFKYGRDMSYTVTAHYGFPGSGYSFWMWTMYLSNNSSFLSNVPLPGFVYFYKTETFTGLFGLPFANIKWTPNKDWTLGFSIFGVNLISELAYGSIEAGQFFTGFNWTRQSFILADRAPKTDRLTFEEKKWGLGFRTDLFEMFDAELQGGYVFDRQLYIGQGVSNKDRGRAGLNSDAYISVSLKAQF